ncbi:type II toxin-antitoxin system RnlB family antitoxin [Vibrio alginolyticus]
MFNIRALDNKNGVIAIVTAIGYENPLSSLNEIELELKSSIEPTINGQVLFDLACSNGFEWNRFMSLDIHNGLFQLRSAKVVETEEIAKDLIEQQSQMLISNPEFIRNSVITSEEISNFQAF